MILCTLCVKNDSLLSRNLLIIQMPLVCSALPYTAVTELNAAILRLPEGHTLRKETVDGDLTVTIDGEVAVLHSAAGYSFRRLGGDSLEEALRKEIDEPRDFLCTVFEVDQDDPSVVRKLLDRFQENHGVKLARKIDHHILNTGKAQRMLVKLPTCLVRHMLAPTGGLLKTYFTGPRGALRSIPMLAKYGKIPEGDDEASFSSVIVTEYQEKQLPLAQHFHYEIVREVLAAGPQGISLGPVGVWDA